jgi:cytochrome b involved in lipid metabolism
MVRFSITQELVLGTGLTILIILTAAILFVRSNTKAVFNQLNQQDTVYTQSDLINHSSPNDCWMVIRGAVYDMNTYIDQHPGGERAILSFCGQDATTAFETKGGDGVHSQKANQDLTDLYIGTFQP